MFCGREMCPGKSTRAGKAGRRNLTIRIIPEELEVTDGMARAMVAGGAEILHFAVVHPNNAGLA